MIPSNLYKRKRYPHTRPVEPQGQRPKLTFRILRRSWGRLPLGWRVGSTVAFVWLVVIPLVGGTVILSGHTLPLALRALEAVSKFAALGVIIGAVRASRKLDPGALYVPRVVVVVTLLGLSYGFIAPVLR